MTYKEDSVPIDVSLPITAGGYVTKQYLIDAYPQLSGLVGSPGLWTWGNNGYGQLGDNTASGKSSPVQTVSGGTNWKCISEGGRVSVAIKTDGTLWNWGAGLFGSLGDNSSTNKSSPIQTVAGGTDWKSAAAGKQNYTHVSAIKTDGTLWSWGRNGVGELGDNSITHKSSPVQTVSGGTNWKLVACGGYQVAAIKTDGTLWLWGRNSWGQLGDTTVAHKSSPVQTVSGGTNWKLVSGGWYHTAAIKIDGTLWLWGKNSYGQLGDTTVAHKSSPVQTVSGGTNWKSVDGGKIHTAAIKTDGTLWSWGDNQYGQLGDNTSAHKSSPVQTVAGGTNWKLVSCSGNFTAAIKTDGTLWTWGHNDSGQLGDNTRTNRSSPVQTVSGGTNWKLIACGSYSIMAIRDFNEDF